MIVSFLLQQILIHNKIESSVPKDLRLKGKNFHDIAAFNKGLRDLGARETIMKHQSQWEALRSFESWALLEEATERTRTPEERRAIRDLEWMPEDDQKPWHQMSWDDWLELWARWMTIHYQYLHASLNDVDYSGADSRFLFTTCEC